MKAITHRFYNAANHVNDIALLKLNRSINFNGKLFLNKDTRYS